jgi:hypothetical protein
MKNIVHYCKRFKKWTSHTYKSCAKADVVLIINEWRTEIKPERKTNPRGWVVADDSQVILNPDVAVLSKYRKVDKLLYDKHEMKFNIANGSNLLFDSEGCHILQEV